MYFPYYGEGSWIWSIFYHKRNIIRLLGLSNIPKFIATLGMITYDIITNATNEYCWLRKHMVMESMKWYVKIIQTCVQSTYLRQPTQTSLETIEDQWRMWVPKDAGLHRLHALQVKELFYSITTAISR
jgi:hypothetical protein